MLAFGLMGFWLKYGTITENHMDKILETAVSEGLCRDFMVHSFLCVCAPTLQPLLAGSPSKGQLLFWSRGDTQKIFLSMAFPCGQSAATSAILRN